MPDITEDIQNKLEESFSVNSTEETDEERINYMVRVTDGLIKQTDKYITQEPEENISTESYDFLRDISNGLRLSLTEPEKLKKGLIISLVNLMKDNFSNDGQFKNSIETIRAKDENFNDNSFLVPAEIQRHLMRKGDFTFDECIGEVNKVLQYSYDYFDLQGIQDRFSKLFHVVKKVTTMKDNSSDEKFTDLFFEVAKTYGEKGSSTIFAKNILRIAQAMTGNDSLAKTKDNPLLDLRYLVNNKTNPLIDTEVWNDETRYIVNMPCTVCDGSSYLSVKPDDSFALINSDIIVHVTESYLYSPMYSRSDNVGDKWFSYPNEQQITNFKNLLNSLKDRIKVFRAYLKFIIEVRDKLINCFGDVFSDKEYMETVSLTELRLIIELYRRVVFVNISATVNVFADFIRYLEKIYINVEYMANATKHRKT